MSGEDKNMEESGDRLTWRRSGMWHIVIQGVHVITTHVIMGNSLGGDNLKAISRTGSYNLSRAKSKILCFMSAIKM